MTTIPLAWPLVLAAALLGVGLYTVLARRDAAVVLMGAAVMFDAAIIALAAFWRRVVPTETNGLILGLAAAIIATAEIALGWAIVAALRRRSGAAALDEVDALRD